MDPKLARSFFLHLEKQNVPAVVLHGYENGFETATSDIDFAVGLRDYKHLNRIIQSFCAGQNWMLCQSLQHEVSATYAVCCARKDHSQFALLDGCADYRVRGHLVLTSDVLLAERRKLDWGGYATSGPSELKYLFVKAAAKQKNSQQIHERLQQLYDAYGGSLREWLVKEYQVALDGWSRQSVHNALGKVGAKLRSSKLCFGHLSLKVTRVMNPSGMWYESGNDLGAHERNILTRFFRSAVCVPGDVSSRMRISLLRRLLMSTLVIAPCGTLGNLMRKSLIARDLYFQGDPEDMVRFLENRLLRRG